MKSLWRFSRSSTRFVHSSRSILRIETLESRDVPSTLTLSASGLIYTADTGVNNDISASISGSNFIITDSGETITTSIPGSSGSGTNMVHVPTSGVTSVAFNLSDGTDEVSSSGISLGTQNLSISSTGSGGLTIKGAVTTTTGNISLTTTGTGALSVKGAITTTTGSVALTSNTELDLFDALNAGSGDISIMANQGGTGSAGYNQEGASLTTTSTDSKAVTITVNTPTGGTGDATIGLGTVGSDSGGGYTVNSYGGSILWSNNSFYNAFTGVDTGVDSGGSNSQTLNAYQYSFNTGTSGSVGTSDRPLQIDNYGIGDVDNSDPTLTADAGIGGVFVVDWDATGTQQALTTGNISAQGTGDILIVSANGNLHELFIDGSITTGSGYIKIYSDDDLFVDNSSTIGGGAFSGTIDMEANRDNYNAESLVMEAGSSILTTNSSTNAVLLIATPIDQDADGQDGTSPLTPNGGVVLANVTTGNGATITVDAAGTASDIAANESLQGSIEQQPGTTVDAGPTGSVVLSANDYAASGTLNDGNIGIGVDAAQTPYPITVTAGTVEATTTGTQLANTGNIDIIDTVAGAFNATTSGSSTASIELSTQSGPLLIGGVTSTGGGPIDLSGAAGVVVNAILGNATTGPIDIYGALSGSGNIVLGTGVLTVTQSTGSTYDGIISGSQALTLAGSGSLILTAPNTYSGGTKIAGGELLAANVTGSATGFGPVTVDDGAYLGGYGQISGPVTVSGTVTPSNTGSGTGVLQTGELSFSGTGAQSLDITINGYGAGSGYDQVQVDGDVNLTGATLNLSADPSFTSQLNDTFTIIANDGPDPVIGTFAGLPEGATIQAGTRTYAISYVGGNGSDVTLTVVNISSGPPVNTVPGAQQTLEDQDLIFSAANGNAISTDDPVYGGPLEVNLTVDQGVLTLSTTTGLTFSNGTGSMDASMTFTGSIPDIQAALDELDFTPTQYYFGLATVTITTDDLGGTGNGVQYASNSVSVNVLHVNQPPSFSLSTNSVLVDAGSETIDSFATNISAGPPDESYQTLTFLVTNDNNSMFTVQPAIDPVTGNLTFTCPLDAQGSTTVTVELMDNGGTAYGGQDTSPPQTFTISVNPAIVLNPGTLPSTDIQAAYSQSITSTGGTGAVTLAVSDVTNPTGLIIGGSGTGTITISGTPTVAGTVTFTVTPTDDLGPGPGTGYTFDVNPLVSLIPGTLPEGEVGFSYDQSITTSGGTAPVTLAVSGVTSPTGLMIGGSGTGTITISGTPSVAGFVTFTVTPTDAIGTGPGTAYSFEVNPAVVLTPTSLPAGEVGLSYNQSITSTGGSAPVTLAVSNVTNSTGVTISGSGTGTITISGTPTISGTVSFTVTPTDTVGTGSGTFYSFDVGPAVFLDPSSLPPGDIGTAYHQTITSTGETGTVTLSLSGVTNPSGLTLSGSGTGTITLSGTPTAAGTVTFTVTPTDEIGTGNGTLYSFEVNPPVHLTPTSLPAGEVGLSYNQSITSTGGSAPVTLAVSEVTNPTGVTISGSGTGTITLSGTPTTSGTVTFTVTPTDAVGTGSGTMYSFDVGPAVVLDPTTLPPDDIGVADDQTITSTGGTGTVTLALSGVTNPTGLTISGSGTATITVSGTPTSAGMVTFTLIPTDELGTGSGTVYSFDINPRIVLNPANLPAGEVGLTYNQSITSTGGTTPVTLAVSGVTNPTGLMIDGSETGTITISGTPSAAGLVTFMVTPTDAVGTGPATAYSFEVNPGVVLTPTSLPAGEAGLSYNQTITSTGGSAPVTLAVSHVTNPTGLTISGSGTGTITISGTPTTSGTVTLTLTPTDPVGSGNGTVYSFHVGPAVVVGPATLPPGDIGTAYHQTITSTGGTGTVTLALSGLSNSTGLTLGGSGTGTITISGTPTTAGMVTFTVTPTDEIGTRSGTVYSFRVNPPVSLTPTSLPPAEAGLSYNQSITSTEGSVPVTLAVSNVTNPTGVTITGSGTGTITLSGTPTTAGTTAFTVTPTDAAGTDSGTVYSFHVGPSVLLNLSALPPGEVGTAYSQTITSTGGTGTVTLTVSGVTNPTGLSISGSGTGTITIAGAPTTSGTVAFTITPSDAIGTGKGTLYTFVVNSPVISPPPPPPHVAQPILVGGLPNGTVQVYTESNGTYTLQETLQPFGDIATDVRTAVGDINGDGIPDYIFAIGPSPTDSTGAAIAATATEFKVMVLSGAPGNPVLVQPFDPFLPNPGGAPFTAGGFVSAGAFLNNGRDQIVVSPDQQGGPRIAIYDMDGAATAGPQPATPVGVNTTEINPGSGLTRVNNFLSVNANFRGGARTAVGDLNGDGFPDLAIAAGFGGGPAVLVINGTKVATTNGFTPSDDLIGNFFAFNSTLRDGAYLAIGDVLGNGQQDLILGPGAGGPAEVEVLSGEQLVNDGAVAAIANPVANFVPTGLGPDGSGTRVAVAASGTGDQVNVVVGAGRNMPGVVKVYPGTGFSSGSTSEPSGGQLIDPFGGGTLTDGIFVG